MWVRLPPRAPVFPFCFQLVDAPLRKLYLFCTCHLRSNDGIIGPSALHIGLKLLLARANPRAVMFFCDPHALMAEQYGDTLNRDTREKQFDGERVAESVREHVALTLGHLGKDEKFAYACLPATNNTFEFAHSAPKVQRWCDSRSLFERLQDKIRKDRVNGSSGPWKLILSASTKGSILRRQTEG